METDTTKIRVTSEKRKDRMRKFLNRSYEEIQGNMLQNLGSQTFRVPTTWKIIDQQFFKKTGINVAARCKEKHSDWLVEVNRTRMFKLYEEIASKVVSGIKPRRYWVSKGIDRNKMELELNGLYDDLQFRIMQTVGKYDFKALTIWRVINGRFCLDTGFNIEKDIARLKKDFLIEIYAQGLMEKYLASADKILKKYGV